jgi:hypothetical protein
MSDHKSGYAIRADLLCQSQGILADNLDRERESIHSHNENHPENKRTIPDRQVNAQDIITVAKQLYEFVNEK